MKTMLNVLVVDDERTIREGLVAYVPWTELGYRLVGSAKNAEEALRIFAEHPVDLLITDIEMPGKNGLALVEGLMESQAVPAVIIISGYNYFDYAQQALRLGVIYDYVLKPINIPHFKELLCKTHAEFLRKRAHIAFPTMPPAEAESLSEGAVSGNYNLFSLMERSLLDGDWQRAREAFDAATGELLEKHPPLCFLQRYFSAFLLSLESFLQHQNISGTLVFGDKDPVETVMHTEAPDLVPYLHGVIEAVCGQMQQKLILQDALVAQAVELTRKHFLDENFSLNRLADQLMISPNYLSTRFKKVTGTAFSKYVNMLRTEKAKAFLGDIRYKVFEVSEMVGFEDSHYFARIFKEQTGLTPAEYRNRIKGIHI